MAKFDAKQVALVALTAGDTFTVSDLVRSGVTYYAAKQAVAEGYIKTLQSTVTTGKRGRPARKLKLTGKGKRVAAK
jgi:hypothetical protein